MPTYSTLSPVSELAQAAGEDDPSQVGVNRQAREIDRPAARVEHRSVRRDDIRELQIVNGGGEAEERDAAVEQKRNALELLLFER